MIAHIIGRFTQLFDNQFLRWVGRISHTQVDDVVARATFLIQRVVDPTEQVGRQALDAIGILDAERRNGFFGTG